VKREPGEIGFIISELRPIERNRKRIRKIFLESEAEWLFQIDDDITPPDNLLEMTKNNKDICSADVRTIQGGQIVRLGLKEVKPKEYLPIEKEGLFECDAVGGGCCLIHRRVLEKIDYEYMNEEQQAEDLNFCQRAKEAGFSVWMDTRFRVLHNTVIPL
jgi:GT2 family glycosyltransferase